MDLSIYDSKTDITDLLLKNISPSKIDSSFIRKVLLNASKTKRYHTLSILLNIEYARLLFSQNSDEMLKGINVNDILEFRDDFSTLNNTLKVLHAYPQITNV